MKILEYLIELFGWLKIVASPLLVSVCLGGLTYLAMKNTMGIILGGLIVLAGLVVGIVWATRIWKKYGTMNYLSKVNASPDLDKLRRD